MQKCVNRLCDTTNHIIDLAGRYWESDDGWKRWPTTDNSFPTADEIIKVDGIVGKYRHGDYCECRPNIPQHIDYVSVPECADGMYA